MQSVPVRTDLFTGVADATHRALASIERTQLYDAGDVISTQGDPATMLVLVEGGLVKIWRTAEDGTAITLALLGPGEPIGILNIARQMPLSATASAHAPTKLIIWPIEGLRRVMANDATFVANVLNFVSRYAVSLIERLEEVTTAPVERRIARALCRSSGIALPLDGTIDLPLSRQDVADLSATTLPTVSRIMARWREQGLIGGHRGHIHLLDRPGLAVIADLAEAEQPLAISIKPS